jgi:hypothetical protein
VNSSILVDDNRLQPNSTRRDLALALRQSLRNPSGLAVAKLGLSEQTFLSYPFLLERCISERQVAALTLHTRRHAAANTGVFPGDIDSIVEFSKLHAKAARSLDFVGLVSGRLEADLLNYLDYQGKTLSIFDFEPDRSIPDDRASCYLPELEGQRVLIVSSVAELLCARANEETFTAVWAKTGKLWFRPAQVTSLQFPWAYDRNTQHQFGSSMNLLEWIIERIDPETFDIALIAGATFGVPVAAAIKDMNRSAIALGGALQVLFGVSGKRWRDDPTWVQNYMTKAWIDIPRAQIPDMPDGYGDGGAFC